LLYIDIIFYISVPIFTQASEHHFVQALCTIYLLRITQEKFRTHIYAGFRTQIYARTCLSGSSQDCLILGRMFVRYLYDRKQIFQ
jgi:hypothetical protein